MAMSLITKMVVILASDHQNHHHAADDQNDDDNDIDNAYDDLKTIDTFWTISGRRCDNAS